MAIIERQTGLIQACPPNLVEQSCAVHTATGEKLVALDFAAKVDAAGIATVVPKRVSKVDAASPL